MSYKKKYGQRIKNRLTSQSTFRKELYQHIPAHFFDKIISYLFLMICKKYYKTNLIDLPYITITIQQAQSYKSNLNKVRFMWDKNIPYTPFSEQTVRKKNKNKKPIPHTSL